MKQHSIHTTPASSPKFCSCLEYCFGRFVNATVVSFYQV